MSDEPSDSTTDESNSETTTNAESSFTADITDTESSAPTDTDDGSSTTESPGARSSESDSSDGWGSEADDPGHETGVPSARGRPVTTYLFWGAFGLLSVMAVVAIIGFYNSVSSAIDVWIASDYQPIFRSIFNLVVLLVCALGLSLLVRQMGIPEST